MSSVLVGCRGFDGGGGVEPDELAGGEVVEPLGGDNMADDGNTVEDEDGRAGVISGV
jgi:hypothetical protein